MNRVSFYGGLLVLLVGLLVWILRPSQSPGRFEAEFFGARFSFDTPAIAVMIIGLAMMFYRPRFPEVVAPPPPERVKKIVCTGEKEENCPGPHDIFYTCGYFGTDKEIADKVCKGIKLGVLRLQTVPGNKCGYSLIEVTCPQSL
jgi:hypothetical protein